MKRVAPVDVRLAVPADRPGIVALTTQLHGENGLFRRSESKVQAMMDAYYDKTGAIIGVIGAAGEPVAAIYLRICQVIYSDDFGLAEEFNFVSPDHRRSNYAAQLIAYAQDISDGMKLPMVLGILSNTRTEAKMRLYSRHLEQAGGFFIYNKHYAESPAWGAGDEAA